LRIQSTHHHADRGLDPYFSPPEATASLLAIEARYLPQRVWEPAAGDGAIVRPLQAAGFTVMASDLVDYGLIGCTAGVNYLKAPPMHNVQAIVTNPPFKLALRFAEKALNEVPYVALLDLLQAFANDASPWLARTSRTQQYLPCLVHLGRASRAKVGDALVRLERLPSAEPSAPI
jgi:hypothetical protein